MTRYAAIGLIGHHNGPKYGQSIQGVFDEVKGEYSLSNKTNYALRKTMIACQKLSKEGEGEAKILLEMYQLGREDETFDEKGFLEWQKEKDGNGIANNQSYIDWLNGECEVIHHIEEEDLCQNRVPNDVFDFLQFWLKNETKP
jgi:hypothetical protein